MNFHLRHPLSKINVIYQQNRVTRLFFKHLRKSRNANPIDRQADMQTVYPHPNHSKIIHFCDLKTSSQRVSPQTAQNVLFRTILFKHSDRCRIETCQIQNNRTFTLR